MQHFYSILLTKVVNTLHTREDDRWTLYTLLNRTVVYSLYSRDISLEDDTLNVQARKDSVSIDYSCLVYKHWPFTGQVIIGRHHTRLFFLTIVL